MSLNPHPYRDISLAITDRATARRELNFVSSAWSHVVSIGDPGSRLAVSPRRLGSRLLRLEFDDVTPNEIYSPETIFARYGYSAATPVHVQAIADFGKALPSYAQVLIHCEQGVSRSTAAASILLMARFPDVNQPEALAFVRQIRPQAYPNQWMLGLYFQLRFGG